MKRGIFIAAAFMLTLGACAEKEECGAEEQKLLTRQCFAYPAGKCDWQQSPEYKRAQRVCAVNEPKSP